MYDFIKLLSHAVRERGERLERGVARRRADRADSGTMRSNSSTDPAWGTTDVGPATEPLTVIPQPVPAGNHIAAHRTGLGRLAF
ncbi:hypothetical protein ASC66_06975 [Leifsonia sp. Root4]|uniref:hypothetical protein n=1 Tax=Leifsonia sp. Root4 TaxID=1736525 RepID=UPI0006FB64E0|nr:hypothetical protein [Leifsonia sp. Root4]KQW06262.1 hypothetical protein ASC66_06975 [Leifsonia sp. Root4]